MINNDEVRFYVDQSFSAKPVKTETKGGEAQKVKSAVGQILSEMGKGLGKVLTKLVTVFRPQKKNKEAVFPSSSASFVEKSLGAIGMQEKPLETPSDFMAKAADGEDEKGRDPLLLELLTTALIKEMNQAISAFTTKNLGNAELKEYGETLNNLRDDGFALRLRFNQAQKLTRQDEKDLETLQQSFNFNELQASRKPSVQQ